MPAIDALIELTLCGQPDVARRTAQILSPEFKRETE